MEIKLTTKSQPLTDEQREAIQEKLQEIGAIVKGKMLQQAPERAGRVIAKSFRKLRDEKEKACRDWIKVSIKPNVSHLSDKSTYNENPLTYPTDTQYSEKQAENELLPLLDNLSKEFSEQELRGLVRQILVQLSPYLGRYWQRKHRQKLEQEAPKDKKFQVKFPPIFSSDERRPFVLTE